MKNTIHTIFKKVPQRLALSALISLAPAAYAAPELTLGAPQDTMTESKKPLLTLPSPHRDLTVYDEQPAHYHYGKGAALATVAAPSATIAIPNPAATNNASSAPPVQMVKISQNAKKAKKAVQPSNNLIDGEDDKDESSKFSLQHAAGLSDDSRIQLNGFLSAGAVGTGNHADYVMPGYGKVHNSPNFGAPSDIGLQVTGNILHNVAVVGQFVANGDNTVRQNPFNVRGDWAYLRYIPRPEIQLRAGRFRLPSLFYSENAEVGYTYPWIILPNEVYGIVPVVNLNGVSSIVNIAIGQSNWTFRSQSFYGSGSQDTVIFNSFNPQWISGTVLNVTQDNVYGSEMSIGNSYFEIRGDYMGWQTSVNAPIFGNVCPDGTRQTRCTLIRSVGSDFYSFGAKLDLYNFLLMGEYAHSQLSALFATLNSYYVMAAYHFRGFMPNLTYAYTSTSNSRQLIQNGGQFPIFQDSVTLGLDYTINNNLLAKVSCSAITPFNGSNGFFSTNPGRKTVIMYGASLNAIF